MVRRAAQRLFGRHIRRSTQNDSLLRGVGAKSSLSLMHGLRYTEIKDLYAPGCVQLDIRRLQIPMDNSFIVRCFNCLGRFERNAPHV